MSIDHGHLNYKRIHVNAGGTYNELATARNVEIWGCVGVVVGDCTLHAAKPVSSPLDTLSKEKIDSLNLPTEK